MLTNATYVTKRLLEATLKLFVTFAGNTNRDFKIVDNGRLRRLDAYTGDLGRVR